MNLAEIRKVFEKKSFADSKMPSIELKGKSVHEILNQAALELRTPVVRLNYEIIARGTSGLLRLLKRRDYHLLVYRQTGQEKSSSHQPQDEVDDVDLALTVVHGAAHLQHRAEGLFLKVQPPKNGGQPAGLRDIMHMLEETTDVRVTEAEVQKIISAADGQYHFLIEAPHQPSNDAKAIVNTDEQGMKCTVTLSPAGEDGADPTYDWLVHILDNKGIRKGVDTKKIIEITDAPHYHTPILIASGVEPVAGENTRIETLFNTDSYQTDSNSSERVDFRRSFRISTVMAGETLAKVHPATRGEPGFTIYGEEIPARPGTSLPPPVGKNVEYNESNQSIVATVAGEVSYNREQAVIEVQEVHVVNGSLSHNIDFPGSVLIKGDVENDFVVKADGNITVHGYVGRSQLIAKGNVTVKSGINGGDSRGKKMIVGRTIIASYINNIGAEALENIEVSDGVVNSELVAGRSIICAGRYAAIVSSYVSAQKEIRAEILGSSSEVATKVQVGVNLKAFQEKNELSILLNKHREQRNSWQRELRSLLKQQDLWGDPQQPEQNPNHERIDNLQQALKIEEEVIRTATLRLKEIEQETNQLAQKASISVQKEIHPGTTIAIGHSTMEVSELYDQPVTLKVNDGEIERYPFVPDGVEGNGSPN